MSTNEEYLDSLLKSMSGDSKPENAEQAPSDVEEQYVQLGDALDASLMKDEVLAQKPNSLGKNSTGDDMSPVTSVSDTDAINQYLDELEQIETEEADQERIRFKEMERERLEEERLHEERLEQQRIREEREEEQRRLAEEQRIEQERAEAEHQAALDAGIREALERGEESFNDFFAPQDEDANLEEKLTDSINGLLDDPSEPLDKMSQQISEQAVVESLDDLFGESFSDSDSGNENVDEMPIEDILSEESLSGEGLSEEGFPEESLPEKMPMPELSDDPNHVMTPEEIAALVAGTGAAEESQTEELMSEDVMPEDNMPGEGLSEEGFPEESLPGEMPMPELSDDPNHVMTPEEIAALVAGAGAAEESQTEELLSEDNMPGEGQPEEGFPTEGLSEEMPMPELSDDPNHVMTPEEIAALVGAAGATEEEGLLEGIDELGEIPTEESIPTDLETFPELLEGDSIEKIDDSLSGELSPEEIDAIMNGGDASSAEDVFAAFGEEDNTAENPLEGMSEEDVVSMLEKAGEAEDAEPEIDENLADLLGGSDDDLSEISDLLNYSDSDNLIDDEMLALLEGVNEGGEDDDEDDDSVEASGEGKSISKSLKRKKNRKDLKEKKEKKGFLQKLLDFIFEEDEEEEVDIPEKGELGEISDENLQILESLESENKKGGKDKKAKEKKPKKEKPPKEKKPKKEKPPKEKKPKKEKPPKEIEKKSKKIPKAKIILVVLLTIAVVFSAYLMGIILPKQATLRQARKDYQAGNYLEAYIGFSGKELNSSDRLMKTRASIACRLTRKIDSYQNYHDLGMDLEALNSLIQGAALYYDLAELAGQCDMENAAYKIYLQIDEILRTNYGIDGETAKWIDDNPDDTVYTINVKKVLEGKTDELIEKIVVEYNPSDALIEESLSSENSEEKKTAEQSLRDDTAQTGQSEDSAASKDGNASENGSVSENGQNGDDSTSQGMFQEIKDFDLSAVNQNGEEVPVEVTQPESTTPPGDGRPVETPKPELKDEIVGE